MPGLGRVLRDRRGHRTSPRDRLVCLADLQGAEHHATVGGQPQRDAFGVARSAISTSTPIAQAAKMTPR
jgi:hypothetical protein